MDPKITPRKAQKTVKNQSSFRDPKGTRQQHLGGEDSDPDIDADVDIHLPRDNQESARTRNTMSSGKSRKSYLSSTSKKSEVPDPNIVRSRGRPIKPFETEPFLSIDTLPPEKSFVSEKSVSYTREPQRSHKTRPRSKSPTLVMQMQRMSVYMSPYNHPTPVVPRFLETILSEDSFHDDYSEGPSVATSKAGKTSQPTGSKSRPSTGSRPGTASQLETTPEGGSPIVSKDSRPNTGSQVSAGSQPGTGSRPGSRVGGAGKRSSTSRNGRVTPLNTPYHSPAKHLRAPNHHIKSPFKHSVSKPEMELDGRVTPSQGLKERATMAAYHINKVLMLAVEKDPHSVPGRLKKGKLKPLYPVNVEGPQIQQCRGIISDTKSYAPSPSRTLQRRQHLINTIPNVHEYLYDRPRTVESVHRTSVASSIDENMNMDDDAYLDSNRSLPDEVIYTSQKSSSILEPLAPENTFIPVQTQDDMQEAAQGNSVEQTPRMFATEIDAQDPEIVKGDLTVSNQLQHELYNEDAKEQLIETDEMSNEKSKYGNNDNTNYSESNDKSDELMTDGERPLTGSGSRPARIGSPSKSVRFADDKSKKAESQNSKEIKQITNTNIAKQQKENLESADASKLDINEINDESGDNETITRKNKQNAKSSCKEDEIDKIYKKENDDDDEEKERDDNRRKERNNNSADASSGRGNSGKGKADNSNGEKSSTENNGDNKGQKRPIGNQSSNIRSRSNSLTRSRGKKSSIQSQTPTGKSSPYSSGGTQIQTSGKHFSRINKSQVRPASAGSLTSTKGSHCSRFDQSQANKSHINKLQVSSVLHGGSVQTVLCPESPTRSRSRSASPSRRKNSQSYSMSDGATLVPNFSERVNSSNEAEFKFFSTNAQPCFEDEYSYGSYSQRSKVRFEGEAPPIDTIFLEEDDIIGLKQDKEITFEALDSEIAALRLNIQRKVIHGGENLNTTASHISDSKIEAHVEKVDQDESDEVNDVDDNQSETVKIEKLDSIRGDYSNLLDKYRQRCMDRSETYGAISMNLVTPRDTNSVTSSKSRLQDDENRMLISNDNQNLTFTMLSDSGHGSADNLSELSRTASVALSEVPRLDLGGSTSDLGLDTGRSDETLTNGNEIDQEKGDKNLLQMVCDQLSPVEQKKDTSESKKETEEDVTKLKVVATTKSLSKSKQQRLPSSSSKAPFPPLCFTINARAPKGYLYYFAYGPDMNPNRFSSYIKRDIADCYWGLLFGFSLVFNKRGTSEEAGGFANLEFNPLRSVEGCLYKITPQELQVLDKCVGYPQHYEHLVLPVWLSNSKDPENMGVAQYCVPALTFIAQNNWTETDKQLPCDYALSQCIKGAHMLTTEYRESLITMATQPQVQIAA